LSNQDEDIEFHGQKQETMYIYICKKEIGLFHTSYGDLKKETPLGNFSNGLKIYTVYFRTGRSHSLSHAQFLKDDPTYFLFWRVFIGFPVMYIHNPQIYPNILDECYSIL